MSVVMPTGAVVPSAQSSGTPPTGWLFCDGSSQLQSAFPALFSVIGTTYGSIDGTHFTLPDLRGRVLVGVGTGPSLTARTLAATGGEESHTLTGAESGTATHSHGVNDSGHFHQTQGTVSGSGSTLPGFGTGTNNFNNNTTTSTTGVTIQNATPANASSAHNTMQPFIVLNMMIKT